MSRAGRVRLRVYRSRILARRRDMGQPVVHFEILGKDGPALRSYYADLFGWKFDNSAPMDYGTVDGKDNGSEGNMSIGGGIGSAPEGYGGHVTFYVAVPDVEEG